MADAAHSTQPIPPPYLLTGGDHIQFGVAWDEAAVRRALPAGISPAVGFTGGINIYSVQRARALSAYSAAYLWADIEGHDSPEGIKGRWMLAGLYGPDPATSAALRAHCHLPVRNGTSRIEATPTGRRAIATLDGQDILVAHVDTQPGDFGPVSVLLNYVVLSPDSDRPMVVEVPAVAEARAATTVSVRCDAPTDNPFAQFQIARIDWAAEVRNDMFAICHPRFARQ